MPVGVRRSRLVLAVAVGAALAAAGLAIGQPGARRPLTPHEDLPPPNADRATPMIGQTGSGSPPAAFTAGDKVLPKPPVDRGSARSKNEPVLGTGGFAADRETTVAPDTNTGPDQRLQYVSVFNPDVIPFKRMSALDTAGEDYVLKIARPALTELRVGGTTDASRDRFWGSVLLELAPGVEVPLPSVAPDMRILSYEVKPRIALTFEKDGADNFYVRSSESSAAGTYRLVFLADADAGYFAPSLPPTRLTPQMVATLAPAELRPILPERVREAARTTLDRIGIDANMDLGVAFNKLVAYFRAFEAKPLPRSTGDIYRDLCDSQAGVCRHRSFAFMITANTLGIPTRYVQNEAHAFVEVWFPERGWQRIDLGGAALRMDVTGAEDKTLHRPRAEDPFAKPEEYSESYTQLEGDIRGLTDQQRADRKRSLDDAPPSGAFDASGTGTGSGAGSAAATTPDRITPDPTLPAVAPDPKKPTPQLVVTTADTSAFRGHLVHVEGRIDAGGKPLPDRAIDVFLAPAGRGGADPIPLGRAVSDKDGRFGQDFSVPASLDLATYEIYLASPEDAFYNAALSD